MHFGMVPKHLRVVAVPLRFAVMQRFICSIYPMLVRSVILFHHLIYIPAQSFFSCRWDLCVSLWTEAARKTHLVFHSPAVSSTKPSIELGAKKLSLKQSLYLQSLKHSSQVPLPKGLDAFYYQISWYFTILKRKTHTFTHLTKCLWIWPKLYKEILQEI